MSDHNGPRVALRILAPDNLLAVEKFVQLARTVGFYDGSWVSVNSLSNADWIEVGGYLASLTFDFDADSDFDIEDGTETEEPAT